MSGIDIVVVNTPKSSMPLVFRVTSFGTLFTGMIFANLFIGVKPICHQHARRE